jgi:predicted permease
MLVRILGIILPVFSVIALGWIYARRAKPDLTWVNRMNIVLLGPALVFSALANKDFDIAANLPLIAGGLGVVLGSGLLAWPFAKLLHQDSRTWVPPMMFNNCGNMGLPLAYLCFGQTGLSAMVTLFTVSNLAHFTLGVHIVNRHQYIWPVLKNPMVLATFLGWYSPSSIRRPDWLMSRSRCRRRCHSLMSRSA